MLLLLTRTIKSRELMEELVKELNLDKHQNESGILNIYKNEK